MKQTLYMIIKWLKYSRLKLDDTKSELCLFKQTDAQPIQIEINGSLIMSSQTKSVLGIIFYSKLQWGPQVENAKANLTKPDMQSC